MKTKLLALFLCLCPLMLSAQDYKKEGDELFQQAQYEKAIKKYKAYIAFAGEDPAVSKRIANAEKCNSLFSRAKSAEQSAAESSNAANYEEASRLYRELYSLHPLSSYKSKANQLQKKADAIRMEHEQSEQIERERRANLEAERKAKLEAERKAEQERQAKIRYEQERQAKLESERARLKSLALVFENTEHDFGKIKEAERKAEQHKTIDNPEAVTRDPGSNDQQSSNSSEQSTQNPNINEPVESKSDEMASKKATGDGRYTILTNDGYVEIPPDNEIWYTTTDGKAVTLNNFNGQLIYHNYSNGRGIYRFKDPVNKIVSHQFNNTEYLTVILPQSVRQIDSYGFNNCSSLRSIVLSRRLRQIGTDVFCNISAEIYFLSPVPQMGWRAMWNLRSNSVIYYPTNEDYSSLINDFPSAPVQEAHAKMRFKAMNY